MTIRNEAEFYGKFSNFSNCSNFENFPQKSKFDVKFKIILTGLKFRKFPKFSIKFYIKFPKFPLNC